MTRLVIFMTIFTSLCWTSIRKTCGIDPPKDGAIRVATFNMALNRKSANELSRDLDRGDEQARKIAAILHIVKPDILLANEVDFDEGVSAKLLAEKYFRQSSGSEGDSYSLPHWFVAEVNTGVQSGMNLTGSGATGKPEDAWGYGAFPGQYGMVVYSRFPIDLSQVRTFQKFLWSDMPNALQPGTGERGTGTWKPYYASDIWKKLRLSSKSHWDVPITVNGKTIHILASHPTPPVFDGPEDRNGCRNHDEIRFFQDYVEGKDYMTDDQGRKGPLENNASFVILGDLNSDPKDGDGIHSGIQALLDSSRVNHTVVPQSRGAVEAAKNSGQSNNQHSGDPAFDTGDFNDRNPGNLRIDYVLPSNNLGIVGNGVFWPTKSELDKIPIDISKASDHHLVWVDIRFP